MHGYGAPHSNTTSICKCRTGAKEKVRKFSRKHRNAIHILVLSVTALVVWVEGFKTTDVAFFSISLITEVLP